MEAELERLIEKRKNLIKAHEENDFTDGIHSLLTDLYPDTAHFIYELLQNAEDMRATTVRFILDSNGIEFEHNGTKRSFNIADIDAITNIGHNSQKKDDPTSIGKFGVGFKAVFAYTATPTIHSGKYHFVIRDYFVPEFVGVPRVETIDPDGVSWTKFSFPFNNPKKEKSVAYAECLDGLKSLDSSAILFLQNIKKIEYMLPTGDIGYVVRDESEAPRINISFEKPAAGKAITSKWLRFHRIVDITDDQGNPKSLPIAIAFSLDVDTQTKRDKIVPISGGGRTFIYFPAEKEYSGLRFHINAPFASTVARDSVRDCDDNRKLIRAIAKLLVDSLPYVKEHGLMNHSFFETLPNNRDGLSFFYSFVFDYVVGAFARNAYLPAKGGGYVTSKEGLLGSASISSVLSASDIHQLSGIDKTWVANAPQKNTNADYFIRSLDITEYTNENFVQLFAPNNRATLESLLLAKENSWLKRFYGLCKDIHKALPYSSRHIATQNIKQTRFLMSTTGKFFCAEEIFILPPNTELLTKSTPIVNHEFVLSARKTDTATDEIRSFLKYELDVREYGPKIEIERLLQKYAGPFDVDDTYFRDLIVFARYRTENQDVDFSSKALFIFCDQETGNLHYDYAKNLYLGEAFHNEAGEIVANAYGANVLWDGYVAHYTDKDLQSFVVFAERCGIKKGLEIISQPAYYNPLYSSCLRSDSRHTDNGISVDYTIPKLEDLLKKESRRIGKLLWDCLNQYGKKPYQKYHLSRYRPNGSAPEKQCDSSLIQLLKKYPWIPDCHGQLRQPGDVVVSELPKDLYYDSENTLLGALKLGSAIELQGQLQAKVERDAKKIGMVLISEEDNKLLQWAKEQQARSREVPQLTSHELLKKQSKKAVSNPNAGDDFSTDGAVNNVTRRETNVEATFRNAKKMKPAQRKLFSRITESNKEERKTLRNWYQGSCQMCSTRIIGYNQEPHFIAKNIIDTRHLTIPVRQTTSLAWNSLCLCPNCAAKYDVCSRDLNGLYEQIMAQEIIEGDTERFVLTIELGGKMQKIHYIPKHFLALQTVMKLIDKEASE